MIQTKNKSILYAFSMHKAPGKTLSKLGESSSTWNTLTMLFFLKESLKELSLIHELGYCHNDIAGRNVMYDLESMKITIIDMGLAFKSSSKAISSDLQKLATLWLTVFMSLDESTANIVTDIPEALDKYHALLSCHLEEEMPMWYKSLSLEEQHSIRKVLTTCLYNIPEKTKEMREKALQTIERILEKYVDEKAETNFSFNL